MAVTCVKAIFHKFYLVSYWPNTFTQIMMRPGWEKKLLGTDICINKFWTYYK